MEDAAVVAILDGSEVGRRIDIAGRLTVGRGGDAGGGLDDPEISRSHAVCGMTPEGLEIQDLGSLNGTSVNGERITSPTLLAPGDAVKIGATRSEVVAGAGGPRSA